MFTRVRVKWNHTGQKFSPSPDSAGQRLQHSAVKNLWLRGSRANEMRIRVNVFVCSRICLDPCKRIEVVSHESGFARRRSPGLSRFARSHTTHCNRLCNKVNLLLRDVILVNFGVHMCAHYLSVIIPVSQTIHIERITRLSLCELPSGEATCEQNDPIPCKRGSEGILIVSLNFLVHDSFVCSKQFDGW